MRAIVACVLLVGACDPDGDTRRYREAKWREECHDVSTLIATTTGTPNQFECTNQRHRMRVQAVTVASNEEAAAVVFCECVQSPAPATSP